MGREVGGMFKCEGTWVNLKLIQVDVWQKPMQYRKAIILQLKVNKHNLSLPLPSPRLHLSFLFFTSHTSAVPCLACVCPHVYYVS